MPQIVEVSPSARAVEFLQLLKDQTAEKHKALEDTPLSISLLRPGASEEDYFNYLSAMGEVVKFTETTIFPKVAHIVYDIDKRRKLEAIMDDLGSLQHPTIVKTSPSFDPGIEDLSTSYALGFMYVIEGSVLGGRFILKHLQKNEEISASTQHRYFAAYGDETGKMWKSFLAMITAPSVLDGNEDEMIRGANHAFDSIRIYFERVAS